MDKLRINLIPPEIKEKAKKEAKRNLATKISIGLLGLLIIITSAILSVVIFQGITIRSLNTDIEKEKTNLENFREKEAVVYFLKNRLDTINKFAQTQHTQTQKYELMRSLIPTGVNLLSLQIDKTDKILLQGDTNSSAVLNEFLSNLTDPKISESKIASVMVDSLGRAKNGVINFSLTIKVVSEF